MSNVTLTPVVLCGCLGTLHRDAQRYFRGADAEAQSVLRQRERFGTKHSLDLPNQ